MQLTGRKANFLGDSITQGHGTSAPEHIYLNVLKERCGLACARNYGIGGTTIAASVDREKCPDFGPPFVERYQQMEDDADLIVVFGGANDFGHGDAPMGKSDDRDLHTFHGALNLLMEGLIEKYPLADIVFMTPLQNIGETQPSALTGCRLEEYARAIQSAGRRFAIPVLDLYGTSGLCAHLESVRKLFLPDGLHPNDAGHLKIAARLQGFLESL